MTARNPAPYPCIWCKDGVEEPTRFYRSVFKNAREVDAMTMPDLQGGEGPPAAFETGDAMTSVLDLNGTKVMLLNGGGHEFPFNESISLVLDCADQAEVDRYWDALLAGGGQESQCGWLKDRFGVSWQVTPVRLIELMTDPDREKAGRVMQAMLTMKKIDVAALERAAAG